MPLCPAFRRRSPHTARGATPDAGNPWRAPPGTSGCAWTGGARPPGSPSPPARTTSPTGAPATGARTAPGLQPWSASPTAAAKAHGSPETRAPVPCWISPGTRDGRPRRRGRHRSHPLTDRTALRTPASTSPRRASGTSDLHPTRPRPPARPTQPAGHRHETTHSGPGATRRAAGERPGSSAAVLRARRGPGVYGPPARSPTPGEQFLEGERGLVVDGRDLDDGQARL